MKAVLCTTLLLFATTCAPFKDSPFSDHVQTLSRDRNSMALSRVGNVEADGEIKIALFADSHTSFRELDSVIAQINQVPNLDFAVNLGDFTDSAYNFEYDRFTKTLESLTPINFTVIGNHDALGAGPVLFRKIFGPSNFFFDSPDSRFVFIHTANLEDPGNFQADWILRTVADTNKRTYLFSHISLADAERFGANTYLSVLTGPHVKMAISGHKHVYSLNTISGTVQLQVPRVSNTQWILIKIIANTLEIKRMPEGEIISTTLKP